MSHWGPAFLWLASIFYFSSRSYPLGPVSRSEHAAPVSNVAHFIEYAGLTILLHRALTPDRKQPAGNRRQKGKANPHPRSSVIGTASDHQRSAVVLMLALVCAIADELYQERIPGRGFELADLRYDLAGVIAALVLVWMKGER